MDMLADPLNLPRHPHYPMNGIPTHDLVRYCLYSLKNVMRCASSSVPNISSHSSLPGCPNLRLIRLLKNDHKNAAKTTAQTRLPNIIWVPTAHQ